MSKYRTLKESKRFTSEIGKLKKGVQRMDEILDGVTLALSANPAVGQDTDNEGMKAISVSDVDDAFVIYYSIPDDETVILESITEAKPESEEA